MPESYRWDGTLPADPATTWDAITRHTAAWQWQIDYEPRLGGTERGLTPSGGVVTAWLPGRHFRTRAESGTGWFNEIDFRLEAAGESTHLHFTHVTPDLADDVVYAQCAGHTDFYLRSLDACLRWFPGRPAHCLDVDVPGSFAEVRGRVGDLGTVYYTSPDFLGRRTENALVRVFGRDAWGLSVGVSVHVFDRDVEHWQAWADDLAAKEGVSA